MPFCIKKSFPKPITEIKTIAFIVPCGSPKIYRKWNAIWDTGATNTFISETAVTYLGLSEITFKEVEGASGVFSTPGFYVDIYLEGDYLLSKQTVFQYKPSSGGMWDIIIGMDIINLGNFSLIHGETESYFSFDVF